MSSDREARALALVAAHERAVNRVAASYERDPARRQDLVQDIWLAVWRALPGFRGECAERTFVFRIAHNRGASHGQHWKRRRTETLSEDAPVPAADPDPEHALTQQERRERLQDAIRGLPLGLRQVVVLTLEGLSNHEVADVLGLTENNVAVRLTRARAELARRLRTPEESS